MINKIKKILLIVIIAMIAIFVNYNVSEAYQIDDEFIVTYDETSNTEYTIFKNNPNYAYNSDLYCIEHHTTAWWYEVYRIIAHVRIEGNQSWRLNKNGDVMNGPITHYDNAKFAGILSGNNRNPGIPEVGLGENFKNIGPLQNGIWAFIDTWMTSVGSKHLGNEVTLSNDPTTQADWENLRVEAENYANSISDIKLEDKTDKSRIAKSSSEISGTKYFKVGPFNWSFTGNLSEVKVYNQDNGAISGIRYSRYNGTNEEFINIDSINSESDFYIYVPSNSGTSRINKMSLKVNSGEIKKVDIWFMKNADEINGGKVAQDMIIVEPSSSTKEMSAESIYNIELLGNLRVKKIDENTKKPLKDVGFKILNKDKNQYVVKNTTNGEISYTTNVNSATEFITNNNGEFTINDIIIGNYRIIETKNPNSGYGNLLTGDVYVGANVVIEKVIENKRQYISISGLAWEDLAWNDGKGSKLNYLYKDIADDKNDRLLQGIDVYLCDYTKTDNKVVKYTKTGADGKYTFTNVNIDKLQDYYIIFRYNGMSYQNVSPSLDKTNGNKVAEGASRTSFNNQYATVEAGQANNVNGKKSYDLKYNRSKYKSEIAYGNTNGDKYPATGVDGQYYIMANTYETYGGYLNKIRTAEQIRQDGTTEMSHINLGLVKREQPDLSLDEDIHSARVQLNGETHVYEYSERMNNENLYGDAHAMEPQVKFEKSTYSGVSYERPMYASDIIAEGNDSLTVHVTYKVAIKNSSNNLNTVVNKITDYFDSKYYKAVSYGTEVNANGSIKNASEIQEKDVQTYNNEYSKATLNVNVKLEPQTTKFIYVEFQVNKQNIIDIVNKDEVVKLDNIVEISSYSIRDLQDAVYAGIDVDSQPGNLNIGDRTTFEDDTAEAPGLSLILQEERKTTGKVFLDSTDDKLLTAQVRQGSSAYEDGEKGISGVTVKLINKDGSIAKVYKKGETEKDAISTTDENGDYTISGFIPGEYYLEYTWGDKTYKVQDYKSTIVDEISYKAKGEGNNLEWYKDEFKKQYNGVEWDSINNKEIRRSDAVDNYATRENIDNQVKTITNASKAEMEKYEDGKIGEYDVIDKITSTTPTFKVNIEYNTINKLDNNTTKTNVNDEYEKNADGTLKIQNGYIVKKDEFKNTMKNIDFGIVERARQILDLNKNVQNVKITLANGSVLVNANVIDGKLENATENIVYLPETDVSPAQIKVEIDSEIIQGSTLELKYKLGVTNISEVEYATEKFYKYGKVDDASKIVTLTPDKIIDYLDNTMSSEIDTSKWRVLSDSEKKDIVTNGFIAKEVEKVLNSTNKVVTSDELANTKLSPLEGNKSTTLSVTGYKILANGSEEETVLENNAEIIQVTKTGGAMLHTTPGNYIPGDMSTTEPDDAMSERFTIIPPTGNGVNYIAYAVLIISSLGILTAGIILIKKYVLKK